MLGTVTGEQVLIVLSCFFIVVIGLVSIFLVPSLLQRCCRRMRIQLVYYPLPRYIREGAKDSEIYRQHHFQHFLIVSKRQRWWRHNFPLLLYMIIQLVLAILLYMILAWFVDIDPGTTLAATATIGVAFFALFHVSEYLRGILAYIWLTASGRLQVGDELAVEGHRGIVCELGPIQTIIHTYMRTVPLISALSPTVENPLSRDYMAISMAPPTSASIPSPPPPTPLSRSGTSSVAGNAAKSRRIGMVATGYVALPLDEQFLFMVPTGNLLNSAFGHYSLDDD